eukprot:gene7884-8696_t
MRNAVVLVWLILASVLLSTLSVISRRQKDGGDGPSALADEHLIHAAAQGRLQEVKTALSRGANVDARDDDTGNSALMWACKHGHADVADYLVRMRATARAKSRDGTKSALLWAVYANAPDLVDLLLDRGGVSINEENVRGDSPLLLAAYLGHSDLVHHLLARGADVRHRTKTHGFTALHMAANNGHIGAVEELVEHGADVEALDSRGRTALMTAALKGHLLLLHRLLDLQPLINSVDHDGHSALTLAVLHGHENCALALLAAGADVNHVIRRPTATATAADSDSASSEKVDRHPHIGDTALLLAVKQQNLPMVQSLLLLGADPLLRDSLDHLAAEVALSLGRSDISALVMAFHSPPVEEL